MLQHCCGIPTSLSMAATISRPGSRLPMLRWKCACRWFPQRWGNSKGKLAVYRGWEAASPVIAAWSAAIPIAPTPVAPIRRARRVDGVLGSLAAMEAIRAITGFGEDSAGKLLIVDALAFRFRTIALPKDPGCSCAG
jgi:hypothetical protein